MIKLERIKKISIGLQVTAVVVAVTGLMYRSTLYWSLSGETAKPYGIADIVDFAFALVLFLVASLCTVSGVAISLMADIADKGLAYRAVLVGMLSFFSYEFLHGQMPRLLS